jgi:hypothetical protein
VGLEGGPLNLVRIIKELLKRKVAAPVCNIEINCRGARRSKLADYLRSLIRYSSLAEQKPRSWFVVEEWRLLGCYAVWLL